MKNLSCLIVTYGYFGDIAFASSIAKKLIQENQYSYVDYLIGFPQMKRVLDNNPYIRKVYNSEYPNPEPINNKISYEDYDSVIKLKHLSFEIPPALEFQLYAGVKNPDAEFKIYTEYEYDKIAESYIKENYSNGKKTIAIMQSWESKTYIFSEEQYIAGIDTPNLGYGGKHRNIKYIYNELERYFNIIPVGMPIFVSQHQTINVEDEDQKSILFECSIIKYCDAFVGTEGGLCNLAAGVGTKTIITGDFVHQLYGWNGVIKKIKEPKLGPIHYFLNSDHIELDPYLSDEQVLQQIIKNV
jgi:hypothetical protein